MCSRKVMVFPQLDLQISKKRKKSQNAFFCADRAAQKKIVSQQLIFLDTKRQRFTQVVTYVINNFIFKI